MASEVTGITIKLGPREHRVVPQSIGRIERKLRPIIALFNADDPTSADPALIHEVLQVFIPDVMPLHEFRGYPSAEAMEKGEAGDPEADNSPTVPEVEDAIETIFTVNGGDRLARFFGRFVNEEVLKGTVSTALATWAASAGSPSLPSGNGDSASTTSTTPALTSADESGKKPLSVAPEPSPKPAA